MAARQIRTISLSRELDQFIADKVASGQYASASEVVRAGLRYLLEHDQMHRDLVAGQRGTDVQQRAPRP